MGTSVVWPLDVALAAALLAAPDVANQLGGDKVYSAVAPVGAAFDYIVLGGTSETPVYYFNRGDGASGVVTLHLWCAASDKRTTAELYGAVRAALDMVTLAVPGFGVVYGSIALVDIQPDADGSFMHGVVRYTVTALHSAGDPAV